MASARMIVALATFVAASTPQAAAETPTKCDTPGHHQFDFWVGRWDVYRADTNQLRAHSLIERLYGGCVVRENWMPLSGSSGGSLNSFRAKTGEWLQVWTDADNEVHEYRGRWTGKMLEMEGTAADAGDVVTRARMTFEPLEDGSVVQTGYRWSAKDKAWALEYKFIYRRPCTN